MDWIKCPSDVDMYLVGKVFGMNTGIWKHKKRGTEYRILHEGTMQCSGPGEYLTAQLDDKPVIVYQDVNSMKVWVRLMDEFFDGRFELTGPDNLENDE